MPNRGLSCLLRVAEAHFNFWVLLSNNPPRHLFWDTPSLILRNLQNMIQKGGAVEKTCTHLDGTDCRQEPTKRLRSNYMYMGPVAGRQQTPLLFNQYFKCV